MSIKQIGKNVVKYTYKSILLHPTIFFFLPNFIKLLPIFLKLTCFTVIYSIVLFSRVSFNFLFWRRRFTETSGYRFDCRPVVLFEITNNIFYAEPPWKILFENREQTPNATTRTS